MRKVLVLLLTLSALGLTTAVAANFDVETEDITSFSTPVSISVPPPPYPWVLYLIGDDQLREDRDLLSDNDVDSTTLASNGSFHEWTSVVLPYGLPVIDRIVDLFIYEPGGSQSTLEARLYECPTVEAPTSSCVLLDAQTEANLVNGENDIQFAPTSPPEQAVRPDHTLRLRLTNLTDKQINLQWGKNEPGRDSRLEISDPPATP